MPLPFSTALSVTVQTTTTPAYSALVMKILLPFNTHSPAVQDGSGLHARRIGPGPGFGQAEGPGRVFPGAEAGNMFLTTASVPNSRRTSATMLVTDMVTAVEAQPRPISVMARL